MMSNEANPGDLAPEMSLAALLSVLADHDEKSLVFAYADGERVRAGFHITEVKAGSFVTVDCGGNPDTWRETVFQVEDLAPDDGGERFSVATFGGIVDKVDQTIRLDKGSRVTIEVSRPGEPMKVHDVAGVDIRDGAAIVLLCSRPAICKPRHRAMQAEQTGCCSAEPAQAACCT